jgi:hypothetical protein
MDALKEYIRQRVQDNLEGHAIDELGIEDEAEIKEFIESQKEAVEKVVAGVLGKDTYDLWKEHEEEVKTYKNLESYPDIDSFIRSLPGDYIREWMCGLGIPGWDVEEEDDSCGCKRHPSCCGYDPHDVPGSYGY